MTANVSNQTCLWNIFDFTNKTIAWQKRSLCTSSGKYLKTKHTDFYLFHKWWFFLIGSKIIRCLFTKLYIKLFSYPAYSFLLSSIFFFIEWKNTLFAWACLFAWAMLYYIEIYHHSPLFICLLLLHYLYSCMTMQPCQFFHFLIVYDLKLVTRVGNYISYVCRPALNGKFIFAGH